MLPIDRQTGLILNHDGYQPGEPKGETPEAAAWLFPVGYRTDPQTERRTLAAAVDVADKYVGNPMLAAMLGVYAARLGDRARALDLFEQGYADYVVQPFSVTTEYSLTVYPDRPKAAPFTANLSGFLTSCLYGLTGLQLSDGEPASWLERPVTMPEGWEGVHVDRLWVKGAPAKPTAMHGERGRFEPY